MKFVKFDKNIETKVSRQNYRCSNFVYVTDKKKREIR